MYRRIELIHTGGTGIDGESFPDWKQGLTPVAWPEVAEAWIDDLIGPSRSSLPRNSRFYFTEKGWREVGRTVVAAAIRSGQRYRIVAIKETDSLVVWRDEARGYEVAVQPPSRRRTTPQPVE